MIKIIPACVSEVTETSPVIIPDDEVVERVGIDALDLYSSDFVIDIDLAKVKEKEKCISTAKSKGIKDKRITVNYSDEPLPYGCHNSNGDGLKEITIYDNSRFASFVYQIYRDDKGLARQYLELKMQVDILRGHNIGNLSYIEYDNYIDDALQYLHEEYGITVSHEHLRIKRIEVNCNILLRNSYSDYNRVNTIFVSHVPEMKKKPTIIGREPTKKEPFPEKTYQNENKGTKIIIYNKTAETKQKDGIVLDKELMRIEFVLKNKTAVATWFGTNVWNEITDNTIISFFRQFTENKIRKPYDHWKNDIAPKRIQRWFLLAIGAKKKVNKADQHIWVKTVYADGRGWQHRLLGLMDEYDKHTGSDVCVLDMEQVEDAIIHLNRKRKNKYKNYVRYLPDRLYHLQAVSYYQHDCNKVEELFEAIARCCKNAEDYIGVDTSV